jgi:hypothetical protein
MVYAKNRIPYGFEDELNLNGYRNINNTSKYAYNCGGYALGTYSWYQPHSKDEKGYLFDIRISIEKRTEKAVQYMLNDFNDLRVIKTLTEVTEEEYAIAFRLADDDFHYMMKKGDKWYSKAGDCPYIDEIPEEEVLAEAWYTDYDITYDGPLVLFAKRK